VVHHIESLVKRTWDNVVLAPEKVSEELEAKSISEPVGGDSAATCSAALRFGHALRGALLLAHVHASVCLIAVDGIIFAVLYAVWAGLGIGRELDESLVSL
jgi:hypothetical protein